MKLPSEYFVTFTPQLATLQYTQEFCPRCCQIKLEMHSVLQDARDICTNNLCLGQFLRKG
jgi:hypothetical protein